MIWSQVPKHASYDQVYLDSLDDAGVSGISSNVLIDQGHRVCVDLESDVNFLSVAIRLSKVNPGQSVDQAISQVTSAIAAYCLDQKAKLGGGDSDARYDRRSGVTRPDRHYLGALLDAGVDDVSDATLIAQGHEVCANLRANAHWSALVTRLTEVNPFQPRDQALNQVKIAIVAYCPDQQRKLNE